MADTDKRLQILIQSVLDATGYRMNEAEAAKLRDGLGQTADATKELGKETELLTAQANLEIQQQSTLSEGTKKYIEQMGFATGAANNFTKAKHALRVILGQLGRDIPGVGILGRTMFSGWTLAIGATLVAIRLLQSEFKRITDLLAKDTGLGSLTKDMKAAKEAMIQSAVAAAEFTAKLNEIATAQETIKQKTDAAIAKLREQTAERGGLEEKRKARDIAAIGYLEVTWKLRPDQAALARFNIEDFYAQQEARRKVEAQKAEADLRASEQSQGIFRERVLREQEIPGVEKEAKVARGTDEESKRLYDRAMTDSAATGKLLAEKEAKAAEAFQAMTILEMQATGLGVMKRIEYEGLMQELRSLRPLAAQQAGQAETYAARQVADRTAAEAAERKVEKKKDEQEDLIKRNRELQKEVPELRGRIGAEAPSEKLERQTRQLEFEGKRAGAGIPPAAVDLAEAKRKAQEYHQNMLDLLDIIKNFGGLTRQQIAEVKKDLTEGQTQIWNALRESARRYQNSGPG